VAAIAPWIQALASRAEARVASAGGWRSPRDLSRRGSVWIASAARSLCDGRALSAALASSTGFRKDEAFCARALIHGHMLVGGPPLSAALRDRAVRFLLARALPGSIPAREPWRAHPLALVEAVMRGHGLAAYAADVLPGAGAC
jgi:lysine-N-methylase